MLMQTSSEVFFRKVNFWDKGGRDAPPVFNVDGVSYLYVKVSNAISHVCMQNQHCMPAELQHGPLQLWTVNRCAPGACSCSDINP